MEWNSLSLYYGDNFYCTLRYPFTNDLMGGLLVAGCLYISLIEKDENSDFYFLVEGAKNNQLKIKEISDFDTGYIPYIPLRQDEVEDIFPEDGKYGIFIVSQKDTIRWDFITFTDASNFMRGFISMSNAFKVDFRNYILGPPYDYDGIEYDLEGYNISPYFTEDDNVEDNVEEEIEDEYYLDD